tara:strand:- start:114 stop:767 length:654 start_codon:yes stop_codon:yes gene_type:complete
MFYEGLAVIVTAIGALMLVYSLKLLARTGWFLGWLRGMLGLSLVVSGMVMGAVAFDLLSFQQVVMKKSIATLSFEELLPQNYRAVLVDSQGSEQSFDLKGDQWQLDARILRWPVFLSSLGASPGYRLDRISGRYYSLEKERNAERTLYSLSESQYGIDVWRLLQQMQNNVNFVDARYGSATYMPMADGALYEVLLSKTGLIAKPLNERAKSAVARWQ